MINKISKIILILIFLGLIGFIINGYVRKNDVDHNGKVTIGKYVSQKNYPKSQKNFFTYYVNGVKYKHDGGRTPRGFSENIGKFYRIKYSVEYMGVIQPLLNEEITDTVAILQAGFSKDDIKNKIGNK